MMKESPVFHLHRLTGAKLIKQFKVNKTNSVMKTFTNSNGCTINIAVKTSNEYSSQFANGGVISFINAITHKLLDVVFEEGRNIYIQICGSRSLNIPKKCKTLQDIAEWINGKDF